MECKYRDLANYLEEQIQNGLFVEGSFLPGERSLCEQFELSRVTVRNGLNVLVKKHRVKAVPGQGYQVLGKRSLAFRHRTHLIGSVFPAPTRLLENNPYISTAYQQMLGINRALDKSGYFQTFINSKDNLLEERECIRQLVNIGVDGLLVMPSFTKGSFFSTKHDAGNYAFFQELQQKGLPIVLMDRQLLGMGIPGVFNDDIRGGQLQTEYFLNRGYRKIIYFEQADSQLGHLRLTGYWQRMKNAGLEPIQQDPDIILDPQHWPPPNSQIDEAIRQILPQITEDTGFITSYVLTPSLDKYFPEHKWNNHRVEWCCYDIPASVGQRPYPCMIRPMEKVGEMACRKLLKYLQNENMTEKDSVDLLPPTLCFPNEL